LNCNEKNLQNDIIQDYCNIDCKSRKAVIFRSASLLTHSKKIKISK